MSPKYKAISLNPPAPVADSEMERRAAEYLEKMSSRHSVREFSAQPVPLSIIEQCIATAGRAPSGANQQPWHFAVVQSPDMKAKIRKAAEQEEEAFYAGGGGDEWISALEPLGTGAQKPHLTTAPLLIVIFAQRYGERADGSRYKHYYVPESVGIATGFLISSLHLAGLSSLTHTPNPMKFLNTLLGRPKSEKPVMILVVGHPDKDAAYPAASANKKPLSEIMSVR
ncbi:MAG: nitroreductase family protein [Rhodobacteraceae bacterium]|nr:nitroreductase family protein [Paracoccaceae bacterium]